MQAPVPVDVAIPTYRRPGPLAVTLACLVGQTHPAFSVVVADQTEELDVADVAEVRAVVSVLRHLGHPVTVHKHLPRRGLAEQRHFLLEHVAAPYVLFLDDDVILEADVLERLVAAITRERCGFVGCFVNAPSAVRSAKPVDEPPADLHLELWEGPVRPEAVAPGGPGWDRSRVHFAAYLHRLGQRLGLTREGERLYKVAWVGGCVLFDAEKLRAAGGFSFWQQLPSEHCGEDVLAQLRVMAAYGGAGLAPSGAWHQEVPTTTPNRDLDAPRILAADDRAGHEAPGSTERP